jgi:streptogramin lyase
MFNKIFQAFVLSCLAFAGHSQTPDIYSSTSPFIQETHIAFPVGSGPLANDVRSIAVDKQQNTWIATAAGIFRKQSDSRKWDPVIEGDARGPAYAVAVADDGSILLGTWDGLYTFRNGKLKKENGLKAPISVICTSKTESYALGPYGIWQKKPTGWELQEYRISKAVRDAISDKDGNLWVATDIGLYKCKDGKTELYQSTEELLSGYAKSLSFAPNGDLWVGVMGGVSIRSNDKLIKTLTPKEGIPSSMVHCIRQSPDGTMWVGTEVGVVRYNPDYTHSLRFSKRWLCDNDVNAIAFDKEGNAWVGTGKGVSQICRQTTTLAGKEQNYYSQLMKRHMRPPWTCGILRLEVAGDTSTWRNSDDDNDGEFTGGYLVMESFRYAVTGDEDARVKARKAFDFLCLLQEVTGTEGFFARSVVPVDWKKVNDPNRTYSAKEISEELVLDPRYKPVEMRWRKSADGKWLWKGDTSSDEMDGHLMSYFYYYEYAANAEERILIRKHVKKIIDRLMETNYNFVDIDGKYTHWGVWSPDQLNRDPDWAPEKSLNSFELLAYLKLASHITGEEKYEKAYHHLIDKEDYLKNTSLLNKKNPAWQIYFDRTLEGYLFPILVKYETDPVLRDFYLNLMEEWMAGQESGENLINNLAYAIATGKMVNTKQTLDFLRDAPLDLMDYYIDHTLREDVSIVRYPILEEIQVSELPPASIRATVRWDKNPWSARNGDVTQVREPVFWLWPYWMARYLEIIRK